MSRPAGGTELQQPCPSQSFKPPSVGVSSPDAANFTSCGVCATVPESCRSQGAVIRRATISSGPVAAVPCTATRNSIRLAERRAVSTETTSLRAPNVTVSGTPGTRRCPSAGSSTVRAASVCAVRVAAISARRRLECATAVNPTRPMLRTAAAARASGRPNPRWARAPRSPGCKIATTRKGLKYAHFRGYLYVGPCITPQIVSESCRPLPGVIGSDCVPSATARGSWKRFARFDCPGRGRCYPGRPALAN